MYAFRCCLFAVCYAILSFSASAAIAQTKSPPAKQPPPRPAPSEANISYGPHEHQLLDVYLPPKGEGPFPVLMWFGALWKAGKHPAPLDKFLPAGIAVVAVEMRVMGDAIEEKISPPVSVCLLDARRAVQFIRLNAKKWNLDPDRIGVGGGSQAPCRHFMWAARARRPIPTRAIQSSAFRRGSLAWPLIAVSPRSIPSSCKSGNPGCNGECPPWATTSKNRSSGAKNCCRRFASGRPTALVSKDSAPIYFENEWGLTKPAEIAESNYKVHSPRWGIGFQKIARERGAVCYVKYLDHPSEKYSDIWDFLRKQLAGSS